MSKSKRTPDTFRKIKKVPSDTKKHNNNNNNDTEFDLVFNRLPTHLQIPVFR